MNEADDQFNSAEGVQKSKKSVKFGKSGIKKPRKLSKKQSVALEHYAIHGNKTAAVAFAGYADANGVSSKVFNTKVMKQSVEEILERKGITLGKILEPLKLALDATHWIPACYANGKTTKPVDSGKPDIQVRLMGYDRLAKLLGLTQGDPERDMKIYDAGREAMAKRFLELMHRVMPHLSKDGVNILAEAIREISPVPALPAPIPIPENSGDQSSKTPPPTQ